jgi:hypothetical protein
MNTCDFDWQPIEGFKGYGKHDAPFVFVGSEEGFASPKGCSPRVLAEVLDSDLRARSRFPLDLMDAEEAHRSLYNGPSLFADKPRRQPTWHVMAGLMIAYDRKTYANNKQRAALMTWYRSKRLGRSDGDTLLMELLPYPHAGKRNWFYGELGRFTTREEYEEALIPHRVKLLREVLESAPRKAIICYEKGKPKYGKFETWERYKRLFPEVQWREVGAMLVAEWNGARVILTNHLWTFYSWPARDQLARVALGDLKSENTGT